MLLHVIFHSQGGERCSDIFEMMSKFAWFMEHTTETEVHISKFVNVEFMIFIYGLCEPDNQYDDAEDSP